MARTSCDWCEKLKPDSHLNARLSGMIVCDQCLAEKEAADTEQKSAPNIPDYMKHVTPRV